MSIHAPHPLSAGHHGNDWLLLWLDRIVPELTTPVAFLDPRFTILKTNQAFAHFLGQEPEALVNQAFFLLSPYAENEAIFQRVVSTRQPYHGDGIPFAPGYLPEAEVSAWEWSLKPISDDRGQFVGLLLLMEAFAVRDRYLKTLQDSQALLQHVFESQPDASLLVNQQGLILSINPQAERQFGYASAELVGEKIEALIPERFHSIHEQHRAGYLEHPRLRPMGTGLELVARHKDGHEFPVEVVLSPMTAVQRTLILTVVRDITERKRMEAELVEIQRRLLSQVETDRKRLAQELHDGPIQDLFGIEFELHLVGDALQEKAESNRLAGLRETLQEVIQSLRETLSELRPQSLGKFGLEKALRSYLETYQEKHPDLEVRLTLEPDEERLPEPIRLALYRNAQQLLANIVQHARAHHVYIRFWLEPEQAILEVMDDGVGFASIPERLELARQGHLGLVGCFERMETLGGKLEIKSGPQMGTSVRSIVPFKFKEDQFAG